MHRIRIEYSDLLDSGTFSRMNLAPYPTAIPIANPMTICAIRVPAPVQIIPQALEAAFAGDVRIWTNIMVST